MPTADSATLKLRAQALQLHGVLSHWDTCCAEHWVGTLLDWEEQERSRPCMERRLHSARIGRFKPLVDYDWRWPEQALAVMALLDDLRDRVWTHYGLAIEDLLREPRVIQESLDDFDPDLPF